MIRRYRTLLCLVLVLLSAFVTDAFAAVVSGTVVSVSSRGDQVVVKQKVKGTNRSIRISGSTRVTLDGKSASLSRIKPGQQINAVVSGSTASRLIIRSAVKTPTDKSSKTTPPDSKTSPRNTPDSTEKRKSTKVASRTTGSRPPRRTETTGGRNTSTAQSTEWSSFRGPNRDNHSAETGLLTSWPSQGPRLAWSTDGLGEGYSSLSVSDGIIYTMGNQGREEAVLALDAATGRPVWGTPIASEIFRNGTGNGPRGTPAVVDGRVYALGANGDLACLDAKSGDIQWKKNVLQAFGGRNIGWGISESPLVDGDKVICTPGGGQGTMVALNRLNGNVEWTSRIPGQPRAAYASAIPIEVGGVRQYVNFTSAGVVGVRASDGQFLWGQQESANGTANCSAPVFFNDHIFTASGYGTGGAMFKLQSRSGNTSSNVVFQTKKMKNHHGGMVVVDGFLYGCDEQILTCINLRNGDIAWQSRSVGKGSVTFADGHLYVRSEGGPVALVEANSSRYVEKGRFDQPQRSGKSAWAHPVVADGKLLLRDMDKLLAYDVKSN